ncbi:VOC family protein [Desnuesiella massiliensis]|uniref:VOC family protein n=1 Tax=Desnuesiella massiliensis TaxID=1650662 RepID=UPI0006E3CC51|nr:VOC family protein [Desnuesiella massiliensis]
MFKRIDTVFLDVKNIKKSLDWYTETLGLESGWKDIESGYASLKLGETALTLRECRETVFKASDAPHFNFYVSEVQQIYDQLKEKGVSVGTLEIDHGVTWFNFKDIDGNMLEVCSFKET